MRTLWCYDPGATTGWACFYYDAFTGEVNLHSWGEVENWMYLDDQIDKGDDVLYEEIKIHRKGFNPIGLEVTGVIKYLAQCYGCTLIPRSPAFLKGATAWPIDLSHVKGEHARDAVRHGIAYFGVKRFLGLDKP